MKTKLILILILIIAFTGCKGSVFNPKATVESPKTEINEFRKFDFQAVRSPITFNCYELIWIRGYTAPTAIQIDCSEMETK